MWPLMRAHRSHWAVCICGDVAHWRMTRYAVCLSVCPERFPGICRRTHGGNGLKFCMLMYLGHLQNWLDYGHGLLIFLLLVSLWLSEMNLVKWVKFGVSGHFPENAWWKWPKILHADISWPPSELISLWSRFVDFSYLAFFLLSEMGQIWGFWAFPGEPFEEMAWNFACSCILSTIRTD